MQTRSATGSRLWLVLGLSSLLSIAAPAAAQDTAAPAAAQEADDDAPPWFTGPLLVPGATVDGTGNLFVQPYFSVGEGLGIYNNGLSARRSAVETTINVQLEVGYGFTENFDAQVDVQALWNGEDNASDGGAGDTQLELHYALTDDDPDGWSPAVRVDYVQVFPTGKFENLDPAKKGTDARGSGVFAPSVALNFMKTFHLGGEHFFRPDLSVNFSVPIDDRVHGLNSYGGGQGTDGIVHVGNSLTAYLSGEYSLTRHWALGFDSTYTYVYATTFSGNPGVNPDGSPADVGVSSAYQITFSPQLEYNFDGNQGLVLGPWFTVAGRDTEDFVSFVLSYATNFDVGTPW